MNAIAPVQVRSGNEAAYQEVLRLHAKGFGSRRIARATGVPPSTVIRWVNPRYRQLQREDATRRKHEVYAGVCRLCGAPTTGYHGPGKAPTICRPCKNIEQHEQRYWTRERVIEAIQRWAAEHGRPPSARTWNHSTRGTGYPALGSVYRSSKASQGAPFASWADAIEAAGFPRPRSGVRYT